MKLEQVESMVCLAQLCYSHVLLPSQEIERVQDAIGMSYFSDLIDQKPENLIRKLLSKDAVTASYICLAHLYGVLSKGEC